MAAAAMGSLSQMSSPAGEGKVRPASRVEGGMMAQEWFDPELDSSLSPILTPSLRHQLRAWMASRSPTPAGPTAATPNGVAVPRIERAHLHGLGTALAAASTSLTSAVATTLSSALGGTPGRKTTEGTPGGKAPLTAAAPTPNATQSSALPDQRAVATASL